MGLDSGTALSYPQRHYIYGSLLSVFLLENNCTTMSCMDYIIILSLLLSKQIKIRWSRSEFILSPNYSNEVIYLISILMNQVVKLVKKGKKSINCLVRLFFGIPNFILYWSNELNKSSIYCSITLWIGRMEIQFYKGLF